MADDPRAGERVDQRPQVRQRERVDQRDAVFEQQLHDHQVRRVRFLGVELGVEPDARRVRDPLAQRGELLRRVDQRGGRGEFGLAHERTAGDGCMVPEAG